MLKLCDHKCRLTFSGLCGIFPLMRVMVTDQKKRIVLPDAKPGEVYSVRPQHGVGYLCVRLVEASLGKAPSRDEVLVRLEQAQLTPRMSWDELCSITRE
jgi:hypothetical protein